MQTHYKWENYTSIWQLYGMHTKCYSKTASIFVNSTIILLKNKKKIFWAA